MAFRSLAKDKTTSFICITGLAVGMACCMLILIHIKDELTFNKFNSRLAHIYRINWISKDNRGTSTGSSTPIPLSNGIKQTIPGIEKVAKLYQRTGEMQSVQQDPAAVKRFQEQSAFFTDADIFDIFSIPFIEGNKQSSLAAPNSIVITDEMSRKYFGNENTVGRSLLFENRIPLKITGVVKKMPLNSDIKFDFLISFETLYEVEVQHFADFIKNDWTFTPCDTWILISPDQRPSSVQNALNRHLQKNGNERNHTMNSVVLQPLNDIHLYASTVVGNASSSDISYIYIFAGIALLILLIANVNFINLSIARSMSKVKEVGVRKVLGAGKRQLVMQFLCDALLISMISFLMAIFLTECALPVLNQLTNKEFRWNTWISLPVLAGVVIGFLIVGLLAGLYPSIFITRFKVTLALKGKSGDTHTKNWVRQGLLLGQFTISIILIVGAIVIFRQMQYLRDKPLGFQKHQMLVVPIFGTGAFSYGSVIDAAMRQRMNAFSEELTKFSKIKSVTASSEMPGQGFLRGLIVPQGTSDKDNIFAPWLSVDYNFIQTLGMQIVAGRDFSKARGTDNVNAFIINESAVLSFGWKTPEAAIGKSFIRGPMADGKKGQIIGVVKDFDFNSLSNPMEPLVIDVNVPRFTEFAINIQPDHVSETIAHINQTWDKMFPERVFEYSFLDKNIDAQYQDKENFSRMIEYFAVVAILLSCSGLFSLSLFMAVKRAREIGIRKVLGANIPRIMMLLTGGFIKTVLLASLIAAPVAWWLMHEWLNDFAYHVNIEWWIFVIACLLSVIISFITIGYQSLRAAMTNPVVSLKSE
jgi:putative ABC transport system permease protein